MDFFVVVAIKDNAIDSNEGFHTHTEAVDHAWKLIKDDLFFDEIDEFDEPVIPSKNPFETDCRAENLEGTASIEILSYLSK